MSITEVKEDTFGDFEGRTVKRFTLTNGNLSLQVISYGATMTSLKVDGGPDVLLGFDSMQGYTSPANPYMGAVVGRVANRIANGRFVLDGREHRLAVNNGPNSLHGGLKGLDKVMWRSQVVDDDGDGGRSVVFSHLSPDGDEGYPGDVIYNVRYSLDRRGGIRIEFTALATAATPVNLTSHAYFNLAGHSAAAGPGGLDDHVVSMACNRYTPVHPDTAIPTGELSPVEGTVFDLRSPTRLGDVLPSCPGGDNNGFDHNFVVPSSCDHSEPSSKMNLVCRMEHPGTGVWLECHTDQPGCQFYTANFFPTDDSLVGKDGCVYRKNGAFCLETQKFPNAVNQPAFESPVLRPGQVYKHSVIYRFGRN